MFQIFVAGKLDSTLEWFCRIVEENALSQWLILLCLCEVSFPMGLYVVWLFNLDPCAHAYLRIWLAAWPTIGLPSQEVNSTALDLELIFPYYQSINRQHCFVPGLYSCMNIWTRIWTITSTTGSHWHNLSSRLSNNARQASVSAHHIGRESVPQKACHLLSWSLILCFNHGRAGERYGPSYARIQCPRRCWDSSQGHERIG